ncbi:MAG: trigger factor [Chloroflexi bacterium]|nr:trigger factor [Chloroflexota bacterium]
MKVTSEKVGSCEYRLTIEVEPERLQEPLRQAARQINQRRPIPGFRPGKAPYEIVVRTFGKEAIYDAALDAIAPDLYEEAIQQSGLEPYALPRLELESIEPLILKATVAVQPVVTLGDYRSIRMTPEKVVVQPQQVAQALANLQEEQAEWVPVERRAANDDLIVIDMQGQKSDGTVVNQESEEIILSEELSPPAFREGLIGLAAGDEKDLAIQYPEDFDNPALAGQEVRFHIRVQAVKEKRLPPLDDDFAKAVGEHETLEQLRETLRSRLQAQLEAESEREFELNVLDAAVNQAQLEYPGLAVERELDHMIEDYKRRVTRQGLPWENYLSLIKQTEEGLRESMRETAERRLQRALVLGKIAEIEGIEVTDEDVDVEINQRAEPFGENADRMSKLLRSESLLPLIRSDLFTRKTIERLVQIAKGEAPELPAQAPAETNSSEETKEKD